MLSEEKVHRYQKQTRPISVFYITLRADCIFFGFPQFSAGLRIGNLLVPNDNYCKFEDWLMPILDQMVLEQNTEVESFIYFVIYLAVTNSAQKKTKPLGLRMCPSYEGVDSFRAPVGPRQK